MPDHRAASDPVFVERVTRYLAADLDAAGLAALGATLTADADARRYFRVACSAAAHVAASARLVSAGSADFPHDTDPPTPDLSFAKVRVPRLIYPLAAALLLAAAAVAVYFATLTPDPQLLTPDSSARIATVLDTTPGSTLLVDDTIVNSGDDIHSGTISLDAGSADFRLGNGVAVTLRGQTQLTVHSPMSATLTRGAAEFDCPPAAKGYTVHLPGGAKVVDLGTRFHIHISEGGHALVRTLEGEIKPYPTEGESPARTTGQLVAFDALGRILPLSSAEVDFASLQASAFPGVDLPGQGGWKSVHGGGVTVRNDGGFFAGNWVFMRHNVGVQQLQRLHDEAFAFSIAERSTLVIECDVRLGSTGRGARVGFIDAAGKVLFEFGNNMVPAGHTSVWALIDKTGAVTKSGDLIPAATDALYRLTATIDLAASGGTGAFSLTVAPIGEEPVPVAGLQNIPMRLDPADAARVQGLTLRVFNGGGIGCLRILHVPTIQTTQKTSTIPSSKGPEK